MRDVAVVGIGMIPFGRRDEDTLMDMLAYASLNALDDAGLGAPVDAVYLANMGGGILQPSFRLDIVVPLDPRVGLLHRVPPDT